MTTSETTTSMTNLAQQVGHKKTPIAIAVAEYIKSLLHGSPETPYIFGQIQATKAGVLTVVTPEVGSTTPSAQKPIPVAPNDERFKQAA